ncbi:MAG: hypothetical protein AAFP85_14185 [Pseudomonadota bacterium]
MKKLVVVLALLFAANVTFASVAPPTPDPEEVDSGSDGPNGALILLALIGLVVASSQIGGVTGRSSNSMDIKPEDVDQDDRF